MKEGEYIRKTLKEKGLSIPEVSNMFGVTRSTIYQYFKSERLSNEVRTKFKELLDIDVQTVLIQNTDIVKEPEPIYSPKSQITAVDYLAQKLIKEELQNKEIREATLVKLRELEAHLSKRQDKEHAAHLLSIINEIKAFYK